MKIKNFTFSRGPSGGLDIIVRQDGAENAQVISSLHTNEDDLYALLAALDLAADEEDFVFPGDVEEQDSEE